MREAGWGGVESREGGIERGKRWASLVTYNRLCELRRLTLSAQGQSTSEVNGSILTHIFTPNPHSFYKLPLGQISGFSKQNFCFRDVSLCFNGEASITSYKYLDDIFYSHHSMFYILFFAKRFPVEFHRIYFLS